MARVTLFRWGKMSRKQKQVLTWWCDSSPAKDYDGIVCDGSIRAGKTLCMGVSFIIWAMDRYNAENFAMCGKTVGSFRRNVLSVIKRTLPQLGYDLHERRSENLLIISKDEKENYFYIFGGKDEASQDLIQGITLAGVFLDEVALMPESFVNQATGRCSVDGSKFWFNCNPGNTQHWFKANWIDKKDEKNLLHLHFTMNDNLSLSDEVRKRYESMYAGVFYRRYILGEWCVAEGLVYPMFGDHCIAETKPRTYEKIYISMDYGIQNATAMLKIGLCDKVWYVIDEYYHSGRETNQQKTDQQYYDELKRLAGEDIITRVIVDPSAASFITLIEQKKEFKLWDADNAVIEGIQHTASCLSNGILKVNDCCKRTIQEFGVYAWDEKSSEDKVIKANDHCVTGDTMIDTENGKIPIKELVGKKGRVWSYNRLRKKAELREYSDVRMTQGNAPIYKITLVDGRTIKATEEHRVLTQRGYVKVKYLKVTDKIIDLTDAIRYNMHNNGGVYYDNLLRQRRFGGIRRLFVQKRQKNRLFSFFKKN